MRLSRRHALLGAAGLALARTAEGSPAYELRDVTIKGSSPFARRFTLLVPKHTTEPTPLLVLFHGKGETVDERLGVYAWAERYGLTKAYERLLRRTVASLDKRMTYWRKERLREVNAELDAQPFRGLTIACPYTPDFFQLGRRETVLDAYAAWVADEIVPRARHEAPILEGERHVGVDGVSLGGYVSVEVFLRRAEAFGAWGAVQGALGGYQAKRYAERFADTVARVGPRKLHVETSDNDVYREDNALFASTLKSRGVQFDFRSPPGFHNQPFLEDSGTLEMLLWHDRALRD